jgi:hypothetical protein
MNMQHWMMAGVLTTLLGCVDSTKSDTGVEASWGTPDGATDDPPAADGDPADLGEPDPADDGDGGADDGSSDDTGDADADDPADADLSPPTDADGDGFSVEDGDCDDTDATIHPDAIEWCNDVDDNCDDEIDNVVEGTEFTWYPDSDGDGFGNPDLDPLINTDCEAPEGYAIVAGDCDDTRSTISPDAVEQCDDIDNDCDDLIDEEDPDLETPTWYPDADGDGFGDEDAAVSDCEAPDDYIAVGGDPDDTDPEVTGEAFWTERIVIELTWATELDDMDLHLLAPDGELKTDTDCYYANCKSDGWSDPLDWGVEGVTEDNPTLDVDDISGCGPEVISIAAPVAGAYTIVVHDFPGSVVEEGNDVTIRILLDSELAYTDTRTMEGEDIFLAIAEIVVSDDETPTLTFTELDEEMTPPDGSDGGLDDGWYDGGLDDGGSDGGSSDDGSDDGSSDDGSDDGSSDDGSDDGSSDDGGSGGEDTGAIEDTGVMEDTATDE